MNNLPSAGWFTDPTNPNQERQWDGSAWTNQVRPIPQPETLPPPAMPAPTLPAPTMPAPSAPVQPGVRPIGAPVAAQRPAVAVKPRRNLRKPILIGVAGLIAISAIGSALGGNNGSSTNQKAASSSQSSETTAPAANWYATTYPAFTSIIKSGHGDSVIALPTEATAGIITATYTGSENFIIEGLDDSNGSTLDMPVNTIGKYSGTSAFGMNSSMGSATSKFKITASGAWTITISSLDSASALPASGHGDGVYKYDGAAPTWNIANKGSANFVVDQYSDSGELPLLVNEIGNYSGVVPGSAGPSIIVVQSDGNWKISQ